RRFNYNLVPFSLAFIVTALFTIHPLHTESVANIKGRDEIMSLLGLVVMALFALRYAEKREKRWLWLIAPVYLLTLLSKENALTYILAVPLMLLFAGTTNRKVYLHTVVAMAAGLVGYLFFRFAAIPPGSTSDVKMTELLNDPFLYATGSERLATVIYTWGRYLWLIIFPFTLTHDYYPWHIEYRSLGDPVVMLLVVMLLVLLVYALRKIRKPDFVAFGILFFIVVFSIQSNLIINIGSFMNERFVFVALLGFMIILGWLLVKVLPKYTSKQLALLVFVLFMIFFSIRTVTRNSVWASDFVLFTSDVEVSERSAKCNVSAGGQLYDSAMRVENEHIRNDLINRAIFFLNRGVELHPAYMQGRIMYGNALLQMNRFDESIAQYMACLKMNPGMKDVLTNINALGLKAIAKKEYPNAVTAFEVLKKTDPGDVDYAINYVEAVMNTGNTSVAEKILDSLYTIHPENAHLNHLLGQLYGRFIPSRPAISEHEQRALYSKSREFLERAVALDSSNYSMRENLAIIYGILGQYDKSVRFFQRAINIVKASEKEVEATAAVKKRYRENYYRLYRNLGDTYSNQGNISKAIDAYYTALENRPLDSHVTRSLARLIAMTGKVTESIALLEEYIRNNPNDQNAIQLMEQIKQLP
ncbi:MAG: tetratricopeptide repeat protein, partial [Bacteroidales bacterium]|nr:tetratricopeptide repeat protein [Bacteroidales bacterium]